MVEPSSGFRVALIGRNSKCKSRFLKAASKKPLSETTLDTEAWWTSTCTPKEADLAQGPEYGFSPSGERLLSARLRHVSASDIFRGESKSSGDGGCCEPILLVVPAEVAFHKGQPRPSRGGVNPIKAVVARTRERLGGGQVPFAVALSVDFEDEGYVDSIATTAAVKAFIGDMKEMDLEGVPVVAVTPRTELWLREQESEGGRVSYRHGDSSFRIRPAFEQLMDKNDIARARWAFDICGGTGVLAAVSAAVSLNPPTLVFPVGDFLTMQSAGWCGDGAPAAALRTCRLMRATSSARDVFDVEKKEGILGGELVSAEISSAPATLAASAEPLPLELDAPIGKGVWLLRLVGSRKAAQLWKAGTATEPARKGGKPLASVQFGDLRSKDRRRGRS